CRWRSGLNSPMYAASSFDLRRYCRTHDVELIHIRDGARAPAAGCRAPAFSSTAATLLRPPPSLGRLLGVVSAAVSSGGATIHARTKNDQTRRGIEVSAILVSDEG